MNPLYVAMDIGGSKLAAGIGSADGTLLAEANTPTPNRMRPQDVVDSLVELSNFALRRANIIWKEIKGVGISFGGPVNYERAMTISCHHLPGWNNVPLAKVMKGKLNLPVILDNDANLGALGEARFGAGTKVSDLFYLTVSSGIGGGMILDGKIYRGSASLAGEIGHTIFRPEGPLCTCGRNGCLQALASGWSIAAQAKDALAKSDVKSRLRDVAEDKLDARAVAEAAGKKDAVALEVMADVTDALGQGIAAVVNILNLPMVVVGGGVAKAGNVFFNPLREAVKKYVMPEIREYAKVVPAKLGDNAPLLGAIAVAAESLDKEE